MAEIALPGLLVGSWRDMTFEPFAGGVEICRLIVGEPAVALLRYAPAATVQRHRHEGLETIMVLDGAQSDEHGDYGGGQRGLQPLRQRAFRMVRVGLRNIDPLGKTGPLPRGER